MTEKFDMDLKSLSSMLSSYHYYATFLNVNMALGIAGVGSILKLVIVCWYYLYVL